MTWNKRCRLNIQRFKCPRGRVKPVVQSYDVMSATVGLSYATCRL